MSREMVNSGIPWIGDIPKDWRIVRNKNVFSNSKILVGDAWNTTQLLSLTTKGIKAVAIGSTSGKVPDSYDTYQVVEKDNIVMCLFDLDCSAVFSGLSPIHGMISPAYKALTIKNGFLPDFYAKWFDYIFDGRKFMFLSKNIRYSLTYDEFASLQVVAPSLLEQQKIASFLDRKCAEIDEMIALQEKIVEELKAYKQSVITEAVTKGLNPDVPMKDSEIEWIGEIPEHWNIDKIIRSFGLIGSGTTPKSTDEDNFIGNIRWIQSGDINGGVMTECKNRISEKTLHTTSALKIYNPPFIIIAMYGASVGNTSISMIDGCVNQACCVLSESHLNLEYSFNVIKSCKDFWIRKAVGGGQPNISQDTIKSTWIPIPPKEEQEQIASYLNTKCTEIDNLISIKLSKIDSLKEYKKLIIYEYVTGKKEVIE